MFNEYQDRPGTIITALPLLPHLSLHNNPGKQLLLNILHRFGNETQNEKVICLSSLYYFK